jgi:predicted esterase
MKKLLFALLLVMSHACFALTQVRSPAWRCDPLPALVTGFEDADAFAPERPSFGTSGAFGPSAYVVALPGGAVTYYTSAPLDYAGEALPLIIALHGAGGPGTQPVAASTIRDRFALIYGAGAQFLIAVPESSGSQGGWDLAVDIPKIRAVVEDMKVRYNVDLNRIYGWGYSAGGQVMHGIALSDPGFVAAYTGHATRLFASSSTYGTPETFTSRVPVLLTHGTNDNTVPFTTAQADRVRFLNAGWIEQSPGVPGNFELAPFNFIGHFYNTDTIQRAWSWMCVNALLP